MGFVVASPRHLSFSMVSARCNTALQSLKPIKYSLEHRNFTLPKFMMKNPRAVWSSRAHPPFSLNRAKPNLLNKHQVEPATARNPTRPTRVDRPGPQSQQAHSAGALPSAASDDDLPQPHRVQRYPIRPVPCFAGARPRGKGWAMAGAFALRLAPRLAAVPPGRGKGGGGASRGAGSRAL